MSNDLLFMFNDRDTDVMLPGNIVTDDESLISTQKLGAKHLLDMCNVYKQVHIEVVYQLFKIITNLVFIQLDLSISTCVNTSTVCSM